MYIDVTIGGKISTTSHMYQVTHYLVPTQLSSPLASSGGGRCYHSFLFDFTSSFILIDKRSPSSTFLIITKQANQNLLISVMYCLFTFYSEISRSLKHINCNIISWTAIQYFDRIILASEHWFAKINILDISQNTNKFWNWKKYILNCLRFKPPAASTYYAYFS